MGDIFLINVLKGNILIFKCNSSVLWKIVKKQTWNFQNLSFSRLHTSKADIKNVSQKGWVLIRKHNFKFEDKREIRNRTNCYAGLAPIQPVSYRFHAHSAGLARDRSYGRRTGVVICYVGLDSLIGPSG